MPSNTLEGIPWLDQWLAELGYRHEQVESYGADTDMIRDFEAEERNANGWMAFKRGKYACYSLTMKDGSKFHKVREN